MLKKKRGGGNNIKECQNCSAQVSPRLARKSFIDSRPPSGFRAQMSVKMKREQKGINERLCSSPSYLPLWVTHVRRGRFKRRDGARKRDGRQEVGRQRES